MSDVHACIQCKKNKQGRFTRMASGTGGAFTKGHLPSWFCFTCLPKGKGRGESEEEAVTVAPVRSVSPKVILADKKEGLAQIEPLQLALAKIKTITTPAQYQAADEVLGKVITARKWWKLKMYGDKTSPGPIPSIKSGLDMLYALNREVDSPLDAMETGLKARMRAFKQLELDQLRVAEAERLAAEAEAEEALLEASRREELARTPAAKAKAAEAMEEAEVAYVETQTSRAVPVQASNSSTRIPKKPVIQTTADLMAFCLGIAEGDIPSELVEVKQGMLNKLYKDDPETVAAFPGVTIIDDIQIVGRG